MRLWDCLHNNGITELNKGVCIFARCVYLLQWAVALGVNLGSHDLLIRAFSWLVQIPTRRKNWGQGKWLNIAVPSRFTAEVPLIKKPNPLFPGAAALLWVTVFHFIVCCLCVSLIHKWVKCRDWISLKGSKAYEIHNLGPVTMYSISKTSYD